MTLNDLLRLFWQRKLLILVVMLAVIVPAYVGTKLITPRYESTSTLALTPKALSNALFLFGTLDSIVPVYADAASSRSTLDDARRLLGGQLADITVETFKGTGIIKIKARSTSASFAKESAEAVTRALLARTTSSKTSPAEVGITSLKLAELDPAAVPTSPVFPRTRLTLFVAGLLGLGFGLGAAFLRENLTTRIESADELARVTGVPVYAEIPAEPAILKMGSLEDLAENPRLRIVAEAFRDLRTNLLFSDDTVRSIIITSPDGSHGKTTVSFGLAATLARAGTRTLLVDGDLRRGRIAQMLELERSPGLMEVLLEEASLADSVRSTSLETLDILPGGRRAGDPGELLTVEFPSILSRLEKEYEAVVVDSTPVMPISDARVMARYADATLFSAREGYATRRQVRQAVERLGLISVKPAAAVLNYSATVSASSYYTRPSGEGAEQLPPRRLSRSRGAASR
jgi:capsular exopolysaccharide synthesis family protein